jgi:predicted glycosyltransferase
MNRPPVILFYVQHLLGVGHVFRATRIARELAKRGAIVHVAWGGPKLPSIDLSGLEMLWLEPVKADGAEFQNLVTADGGPVDEALKQRRREALLAAFEALRPDMLLTEAYPFGRRQMRFELEPLMRAARAAPWRPVTVASIRDILTEGRKASSLRESLDAARDWFDLVLVHGDPAMVRIGETLPDADEILGKIRYTGIVTPDPPDLSVPPSVTAQVVVSAGGGAVGHALTAATTGAMALSRRFPSDWLLIVGPERPMADYLEIERAAPAGMQVRRFVPDLARIFASAQVSVSRAGYNTAADLMRAGCRSVLVPFAGGRETEQLRRAQILSRMGLATMLTDEELTPQSLAEAVDRAADLPPMAASLDMEGAANSAAILLEFLEDRRSTG